LEKIKMPRTLTLHTFAEKRPDHDQEIFYFRTSSFYSSVEPLFTTVEYSWVEYDENGDQTGLQIIYDPSDPETPEGCQLEIILGQGSTVEDSDLWCDAGDIDVLTEVKQDESHTDLP
jgi:hypothetical protein